MSEKDSLIADQQLEIRNLKKFKDMAKRDMKEINSMLICIGGPLNDNVLKYSHTQLQTFFKIERITGEYS